MLGIFDFEIVINIYKYNVDNNGRLRTSVKRIKAQSWKCNRAKIYQIFVWTFSNFVQHIFLLTKLCKYTTIMSHFFFAKFIISLAYYILGKPRKSITCYISIYDVYYKYNVVKQMNFFLHNNLMIML